MTTLSFADLSTVEAVSDGILVRFHPRNLNEANARALTAELFALASQGNGPHLYLDLSAVESLTHRILLWLIALDKRLQDLGDRLLLLNPSPCVREALHDAQLAQSPSVGQRVN